MAVPSLKSANDILLPGKGVLGPGKTWKKVKPEGAVTTGAYSAGIFASRALAVLILAARSHVGYQF